jgi:hypothetical protein
VALHEVEAQEKVDESLGNLPRRKSRDNKRQAVFYRDGRMTNTLLKKNTIRN